MHMISSALRAPFVVCGQVHTRTRWPHAATGRSRSSLPHRLSRTGCDRQSHLVHLVRWGGVCLLRTIGNRGGLGETLWNCPDPCDRCSIMSVRRLAWTDFDTNDSPTASPPNQCADVGSKT